MGIKLKSKIFKNMLLMSVVCIMISVSISVVILYKNVESQIVDGNETDARYIQYFVEKFGEDSIEEIGLPEGKRITLISSRGDVIYDSVAESSDMQNHMERPEVRDAAELGVGKAKRVSDTLSETSYYYAVRLADGNVLRVATTSNTVYRSFKAVIPMAVILVICVTAAAAVLSRYLTKKIVRPINTADINDMEKMAVYDEMAPFASKIRHQNDVINRQLKDLREKKLEFETITENMNEGLIVIGRKGQVISYNKSAIRLLDVDAPAGILNNALLFNRSTTFERVVNEALDGGAAECSINSSGRVCQIMANPVMDGEKVKGAVILIIDITEKEKRETLRREFSANVSHELKTPLTSISGYAEIMKSGIVKSDDMVKFADIIYTEARRLIDLVGDIIRVSKLDENNVQLDVETVDLMSVSQSIAERLRANAGKRNISIAINTAGTMETGGTEAKQSYCINSYAQIADEMIYNIVDNAIKYNKDDGAVTIDLSEDEHTVTVRVRDTGIGIPKEDIERVFERFYRVDKSHSKEVGGTGLGMSIVKHGAAFIGADVSLESEEGIGTSVTIEFKRNIEFKKNSKNI